MENKLVIKLHSTGEWGIVEGYPSILGASGENEVTKVYVQIPSFLKGWKHFLEFAKPNGEKIVSAAMDEIIEDEVRYAVGTITSAIIDISGKYRMEYRGNNGTKVWKSKSAVILDVYAAINAGKEVEYNNPDFVAWVTIRLEEIEKDISLTNRSLIHGVRFYGDDPNGVRMFSSANLASGINGNHNNFDKMYPWCDMKEFIDNNSDVFIKVPLFYVKVSEGEENGEVYTEFLVSGVPQEGFKPHAAFVRADGSIAKCFYIARYEASFDNNDKTSIGSKSGKMPANSITISEFRSLARIKGNQLMDIRQYMAVSLLFMIEFGTRDAQSVLMGSTQGIYIYPNDERTIQVSQVTNTIAQTLEGIGGDEEVIKEVLDNVPYIYIMDENSENSYGLRHIEGYEFKDIEIPNLEGILKTKRILYVRFDGDPIDIDREGFYWCLIAGGITQTGLTDKMKVGTTVGGVKNSAISYRGIENPWGNLAELVDGFLSTGCSTGSGTERKTYQAIYISFDPKKYDDNPNESYKVMAEQTIAGYITNQVSYAVYGYASEVRNVEGFEGIMIPKKGAASRATGYCDYVGFRFTETSVMLSSVACVGGSSIDGLGAGPFCFQSRDTSGMGFDISARLSKSPPEED